MSSRDDATPRYPVAGAAILSPTEICASGQINLHELDHPAAAHPNCRIRSALFRLLLDFAFSSAASISCGSCR